MKAGPAAADPKAYAVGIDGWRRERVEALRTAVLCVEGLEEVIKWGHLVRRRSWRPPTRPFSSTPSSENPRQPR